MSDANCQYRSSLDAFWVNRKKPKRATSLKLQYIRRWHQVCKHLKSTLIALCLMPKWVKFQGLLGESWKNKKKYIATSLKLQYFNLYKYFVLNLRRTNKYFFCWNDETFLRFYFDCTLLCWNSTWELFRFCLDSVEIFLRSCLDLAEIHWIKRSKPSSIYP